MQRKPETENWIAAQNDDIITMWKLEYIKHKKIISADNTERERGGVCHMINEYSKLAQKECECRSVWVRKTIHW